MMAYHQILNKTVESLTLTPSTQPLALSGSLKRYPSPPTPRPLANGGVSPYTCHRLQGGNG